MNTLGTSKQLVREKTLLKKTIGELEMRISTQRQSLATKDDTIKKLFHLVKSASGKAKCSGSASGSEVEALTAQLEACGAASAHMAERLQEEERRSEALLQRLQRLQQEGREGEWRELLFWSLMACPCAGEAFTLNIHNSQTISPWCLNFFLAIDKYIFSIIGDLLDWSMLLINTYWLSKFRFFREIASVIFNDFNAFLIHFYQVLYKKS